MKAWRRIIFQESECGGMVAGTNNNFNFNSDVGGVQASRAKVSSQSLCHHFYFSADFCVEKKK
jgi:hypothetical protein